MHFFGCNPGGHACQQVLRAKHLLKMHVFGYNPGGNACQQVLRARAIGSWARYLGLGTLAKVPWRREILKYRLLAAGPGYLGLGTLA